MLSKALMLLAGAGAAFGCSYVGITAPTGEEVVGRTMELGFGGIVDHGNWQLVKVPAGKTLPHADLAMACYGIPLAGFQVKHNFVGVAMGLEDQFVFSDGMNDKGLTVGIHILRESQYELPNMTNPAALAKSICYSDVNGWLLAEFSSIADIEARIGDYHVIYNPQVPTARVQFTLTDATGEHAIMEWLGGKLNLVKNKVKVVSNDPSHDWHLKNLVNYMQVNGKWADRTEIAVDTHLGPVPVQTAHGVNLGGLPGDATPPSRFVRMFYLRQYANLLSPVKNLADTINLVTAVLNGVFIPKGSLASNHHEIPTGLFDKFMNVSSGSEPVESAVLPMDYTEWSALKVTQTGKYLVKTYMNNQWRMIDLQKVRWGCKIVVEPLFTGSDGIADITKTMKDAEQ